MPNYHIVPFDYNGTLETVIFHVKILLTQYSDDYSFIVREQESCDIVYCNYLDELYDYNLFDIDYSDSYILKDDCEINNNLISFNRYENFYENYTEVFPDRFVEVEYDAKFCVI